MKNLGHQGYVETRETVTAKLENIDLWTWVNLRTP